MSNSRFGILALAFGFLCLTSTSPAWSNNEDKVTFVDLTGKKFKGPDADLSLFTISEIQTRCGEDYNDTTGKKIISWRTLQDRSLGKRLTSYVVALEVLDRKGKQQWSGKFTWDWAIASSADPRRVSKELCAHRGLQQNDAAIVPVENIKYATVNYWVESIHWVPESEVGTRESPAASGSSQKHNPEPTVDPKLAEMERSCKSGKGEACFFLGLHYGDQGDGERAVPLYKIACEQQVADGCANIGYFKEIEGRPQEAGPFYKKGCELGSESGCVNLGLLEDKAGNTREALRWFGKACSKNMAFGCVQLGIKSDSDGKAKEAEHYWKRACDAKVSSGCALLSDHYRTKGKREEAEDMLKKACKYGQHEACRILRN